MSLTVRAALFALAVSTMFPASAETNDNTLGAFPGCEWRQRPQQTDGKLWFYCRNDKGKWERPYNGEEFDTSTVDKARAGDPHAIGILGDVYLSIGSQRRDVPHAVALLRRAAKAGDTPAAIDLARQYIWGMYGIEKDQDEAVRLLQGQADRGDVDAMRWLGITYELKGHRSDLAEAARWYRAAEAKGDAEAAYSLGKLCLGIGCSEPNPAEGFRAFRHAAEMGNASAMLELAKNCADKGCPAPDRAEALHWYTTAADAGNEQAMFGLAALYREKEPAKAEEWENRGCAQRVADLVKNADKFDPDEDYGSYYEKELGGMYLNGTCTKKNPAEGVRWYRRAAQHGEYQVALILAEILEKGEGVLADKAEAAKWTAVAWEIKRKRITEEAERGVTESMLRLATLYLTGNDPNGGMTATPDAALGARWVRRAAEAGDPRAMMLLGEMYSEGKGVEKNAVEAKAWRDKAAGIRPTFYAPADKVAAMLDKDPDPFHMIEFALRLRSEGRKDDCVFWWYLGRLRMRPYAPEHSGASLAMGALAYTEGPEVNQYALGDIPKFVATLDRVLDWDTAHPDPKADAAQHEKDRDGFKKFREKLLAEQKKTHAATPETK